MSIDYTPKKIEIMAVGEGFEPPVHFHAHRFSRPLR